MAAQSDDISPPSSNSFTCTAGVHMPPGHGKGRVSQKRAASQLGALKGPAVQSDQGPEEGVPAISRHTQRWQQ